MFDAHIQPKTSGIEAGMIVGAEDAVSQELESLLRFTWAQFTALKNHSTCCTWPGLAELCKHYLQIFNQTFTDKSRYSETINLLYTSNAFDFRYPHTVVSFCSTVPQHRLNLIKSLHLTCDIWDLNRVDVDPNLTSKVKIANSETEKMILEECFAAISRLEGLKVLRIEDLDRDRYSRNYHYAFSRDIQKMLVQSLRGIRQKEIFEVKTSWFAEENWRELGDLSLVEGDGSTTGHSLFHL